MPNVIATLRAVEPVHRSLALGVESIVFRCGRKSKSQSLLQLIKNIPRSTFYLFLFYYLGDVLNRHGLMKIIYTLQQVGGVYPRPDPLRHADRQHLRLVGQEGVRRLRWQLPRVRQLDDGLLHPGCADDGQGARRPLLRWRVVLQQEVTHQR